jgi:hypothetical protein
VKVALANPYKLASALGLVNERSERQARGIIVNCPSHEDRGRPNCSITIGPDGTSRVKCHACGFTGDALTLVAVVHGLDMSKEFKRTLCVAAELAGQDELAAEIADGRPRPDRIHIPEPRQLPVPEWPAKVQEFWDSCETVDSDAVSCRLLGSRGLSTDRIKALNLARVLPRSGQLPGWAHYGRRNWRDTSNRIVIRSWDHDGALRSVRAWRVTAGDSPKRLPPAGCRSAGLVLADRLGWKLLTGESVPSVLWIVEGEPDWLAATLAAPGGHAVWGIGSGSWTAGFAEKARLVSRVMVATHPDEAGDRYAVGVIRGQIADAGKNGEPAQFDVDRAVNKAVRWRPEKDLDELGKDLQGHMGCAAKWSYVPHALGD